MPGVTEPFDVVVEESSTRVSVTCSGEIDITTSEQFDAAIAAAFERAPRAMRVDMTAVPFMGSEGVRCLVRLEKRAQETGLPVEIVASRRVRHVLEVAGLAQHVRVEVPDDQEDA